MGLVPPAVRHPDQVDSPSQGYIKNRLVKYSQVQAQTKSRAAEGWRGDAFKAGRKTQSRLKQVIGEKAES